MNTMEPGKHDHSSQFGKLASTRSFIGGIGLALAVFLTGIRIYILRNELAEGGIIDGLWLIVAGSRQDWIVVLSIFVVALALAARLGDRRGYFTLWRSGGLQVNLDVASNCLTQDLLLPD